MKTAILTPPSTISADQLFSNLGVLSKFENKKQKTVQRMDTDSKSVSNATLFNDSLKARIKQLSSASLLPKNIEKEKKSIDDAIAQMESLFVHLEHESSKMDVSISEKMNKLISLLKDAKDNLSYLSDFLQLAISIHKCKTEVKNSSKNYSFDELMEYLEA